MPLFWTIFRAVHYLQSRHVTAQIHECKAASTSDGYGSDVQTASSNLPVIGQIANGVDYLQNQLGSAIKDFKNIYSEFQDTFCTPAQYTPPTSVPANLTGAPTLASLRLLEFLLS